MCVGGRSGAYMHLSARWRWRWKAILYGCIALVVVALVVGADLAQDHWTGADASDVPVVAGVQASEGRRLSDMFKYHKDLLPLDVMDYVTFGCSAIGLIIAAGGGIGGGGILVPLYMILLKFRPKHAIALSNFTIFGGSIANTLFNVQKSGPSGRPLIDWDIIVIMEPSTIAGAVMGSFASKYLPDFVLTVALVIVLGLLSHRTMEKGVKMFRKENEQEQKTGGMATEIEMAMQQQEETARLMPKTVDSAVEERSHGIPWLKVFLLTLCFVGCVVLTVLKGSGHGSIIGVVCGSVGFWIISCSFIPWVLIFGALFRCMLVAEHELKLQENYEFQEGDIKWDSESTIRYPLICTLAGIFAGLFGVGGGIVKGPLMLEMGVHPSVASATAATMILFTTSAACVSFVIFGLLEPGYGLTFFVMGLLCTAVGQAGMNQWMKTAKRHSPPVLSIGTVMTLSTLLVAIEAVEKGVAHAEDYSKLFQPSSICSKSE